MALTVTADPRAAIAQKALADLSANPNLTPAQRSEVEAMSHELAEGNTNPGALLDRVGILIAQTQNTKANATAANLAMTQEQLMQQAHASKSWFAEITSHESIMRDTTYDAVNNPGGIYGADGRIRHELIENGTIVKQGAHYFATVDSARVEVAYRQHDTLERAQANNREFDRAVDSGNWHRASVIMDAQVLQLTATGAPADRINEMSRAAYNYRTGFSELASRGSEYNVVRGSAYNVYNDRSTESRVAQAETSAAYAAKDAAPTTAARVATAAPTARIDFNGDGKVDQADLATLKNGMDKDHNGKVETDELNAFVAAQKDKNVDIAAIAKAMKTAGVSGGAGNDTDYVLGALNAAAPAQQQASNSVTTGNARG